MEFNKSLTLKPDQYYPEKNAKNLIVLHHTVGGSVKSTADYWASNPDHIATAFIVERDGTIYQMFDPSMWAHHVGSKSKLNTAVNKRSIGIEIASEGGLTLNKDRLYTFGIISERTLFPKNKAVDLGKDWRGYRYFDPYDESQLSSVIELVHYLCKTFNISNTLPENKLVTIDNYVYKDKYLNHVGICGHAHLRADKSDVHPFFPWDKL